MLPCWPPLKTISGPLALKGACSGNSTSASAKPLPMIASLQAASACWVVLASSSPDLQTGRPLGLRAPFLSTSPSKVLAAGGWVPSLVEMSALSLKVIGVNSFFESAFGVIELSN